MEVWNALQILNVSEKSWFGLKDKTQEMLNALSIISQKGSLSSICDIIKFLKDTRLQEATSNTIVCLLKKPENKRDYYNSLKYCPISVDDIDFYQNNFSSDVLVELLAISSLNHNGYVREKAVRVLSQISISRAIPFLLFRLADWVPPVREAARIGIKNYTSIQYLDTLIENISILEWLMHVERSNLSEVYKEIMELLVIRNRDYVLLNFSKYHNKQRFIIGCYLSKSFSNDLKELALFLKDSNFLVRLLVMNHFEKLSEGQITVLLKDQSPKIRLDTLNHLKDRFDFKEKIRNHLADNAANVRFSARYYLKELNFAEFYYANLLAERQIIGSLLGLAEIEAKQYTETVKKFLNNKSIKIRKAAFWALLKLDNEIAYEYALENLACSMRGLRSKYIDYLSQFKRTEVIDKARALFTAGDLEIKQSMLELYSKIGGWKALPELMLGTIEEHETIRMLSLIKLNQWKNEAHQLYTKPTQEESERAWMIFKQTNEIHESKKYFPTNPITEIDFYLI